MLDFIFYLFDFSVVLFSTPFFYEALVIIFSIVILCFFSLILHVII